MATLVMVFAHDDATPEVWRDSGLVAAILAAE
jgi:hypothetical protein